MIELDAFSSAILIESLEFVLPTQNECWNVWIRSDTSGPYMNGYNNGYSDGKVDGYDNGVDAGKDVGYKEGYLKGQADAFKKVSEGSLGESVRTFVYSLFDAPVSTFTSIFQFEIDGINLGSVVAFFLTLIILGAVFGIVKPFLPF